MNAFTKLLYRLAGVVPEHVAECPAAEQQRYRNIGYGMAIVGFVTAFSAHHAALLCGFEDPAAWIPSFIWALIVIACDRAVVMALSFRSDRATPVLAVVVRIAFLLINGTVLAYFALLAYSQDASARIRFDQKRTAIAADQVFFDGQFRVSDHKKDVADSETAVKGVDAKLALVPDPIANLRNQVKICKRDLDELMTIDAAKRFPLKAELASVESKIAALSSSEAPNELADARASADQIRARLANWDRQESSKRRACEEVADREADASIAYYGPLRQELAKQRNALNANAHDLAEARGKMGQAMAESETVSAAAYGFNLSGESGALLELLDKSWMSKVIALVIFLGSLCVETLPILQKIRARGGPYDQRVSAEDQAYETAIRKRFEYEEASAVGRHEVAAAEAAAANKKALDLLPLVVEISKPLTLFALGEGEIAKTRPSKEEAVKADPSRIDEIERSFYAAVAKARRTLAEFMTGTAGPTAARDIKSEARAPGRPWAGASKQAP